MSELEQTVSQILVRPVRWEAQNHWLNVFYVDAAEQFPALKKLRAHRAKLLRLANGRITFIFHTVAESKRLYPEISVPMVDVVVELGEIKPHRMGL